MENIVCTPDCICSYDKWYYYSTFCN